MGVESRHYLIPRPNRFRPSPEQVCALVADLTEHHWVHNPLVTSKASPARNGWYQFCELAEQTGLMARTSDPVDSGYCAVPFPLTFGWVQQQMKKDLILMWPVVRMDDTDLRYPLRPRPAEPYYTLELHLCSDYVYHMSELIDPFPNKVWCACGQLLEYYAEGERSNIFSSSRIHCVCPNCRSDFDPARQCARVRHGWTGETIGFIPGGAAYRFAVVVDCGKCIPDREMGRIDFEPDLVSVCKKRLGCDFYQLTDLY